MSKVLIGIRTSDGMDEKKQKNKNQEEQWEIKNHLVKDKVKGIRI